MLRGVYGRVLGWTVGSSVVARALTLSSTYDMSGGHAKIVQFPALRDNYAFLVHCPATKKTAAIDTPEVGPILAVLEQLGWELTHILNTHHHHDHAGGNGALKAKYPNLQIVAPKKEAAIIGDVDTQVQEGDIVKVGDVEFSVMDVGGHTLGHVAYYSSTAGACFVGDSIFAMGCGRMFEGTYPQFTKSLEKLAALPDDTKLYCAHEYTAANGRFALSVDPDNLRLKARVQEVARLRAADEPTVPTTVALEKETNPFIRFDALKPLMGLGADASNVDVFAAVRRAKDAF